MVGTDIASNDQKATILDVLSRVWFEELFKTLDGLSNSILPQINLNIVLDPLGNKN
jgi:hypothetical protein